MTTLAETDKRGKGTGREISIERHDVDARPRQKRIKHLRRFHPAGTTDQHHRRLQHADGGQKAGFRLGDPAEEVVRFRLSPQDRDESRSVDNAPSGGTIRRHHQLGRPSSS